jgi:TonB family protein
MHRSLCALLAVALLGASAPTGAPTRDRLPALVGTWTCRAPDGALSTLRVREDGDAIVADTSGTKDDTSERFTRDPATGGWRAAVQRRGPWTSLGTAPPWTDETWTVSSTVRRYARYGDSTSLKRTTYDADPDGTLLRRTVYGEAAAPTEGVACARGSEPPPANRCALDDLPPMVLAAAQPVMPFQDVTGVVRILVTLDPQGRPTDEKIVSSPGTAVNASALAAAKRTRYRPAYHDCVPVASTYLFALEYSSER